MAGFPFGAGGIPFPFPGGPGGGFFAEGGPGGAGDDDEPDVEEVDYYKVLGLERSATAEQIRKAHKRLRVKLHPDRPGGDTEKFQAVERAGHVLNNDRLRNAYDRGGEKLVRRMEGMMGDEPRGGSRSTSSVPPVRVRIGVGLSKLTKDFSVEINVDRKIIVPVHTVDKQPPGTQLAMMRLPPSGAPTRVYVRELSEPVEVHIPAGCPDGRRLRIHGKGHTIAGETGDVEISVSVKGERGFESEGPNLITRLKVPLGDAILGGTVDLRHIDGRHIKISIPAGVKDDQKLMIRSQGLPIAGLGGHARGLLVGIVKVVWPSKIDVSAESEETIAAVRRLLGGGSASGGGASGDDSDDDEWGPETAETRVAGAEEATEVESIPFNQEEFRAAVNAAHDPEADQDHAPGGGQVVECAIA